MWECQCREEHNSGWGFVFLFYRWGGNRIGNWTQGLAMQVLYQWATASELSQVLEVPFSTLSEGRAIPPPPAEDWIRALCMLGKLYTTELHSASPRALVNAELSDLVEDSICHIFHFFLPILYSMEGSYSACSMFAGWGVCFASLRITCINYLKFCI